MNLGAFSVSLAVKDLPTSMEFYARLGFQQIGGDIEHNWVILRSGNATIGLFQGMFETNILTFNPGWDADGNPVASFEDVRTIQDRLRGEGIELVNQTDPEGKGPASIVVVDPDGNPILIDQHVDA